MNVAFSNGFPTGVMDCLPIGVVLADDKCRILMTNCAARDILREDDGLTLRENCLVATSSQQTMALRRLVNHVLHGADADFASRRGVIAIPRRSCRRSYEIVVISMGSETGTFDPAIAAIFIGCEMVNTETAEQIVAHLYSLTAAEARVAAELMLGKSLTEVAGELGIAKETARKHLGAVFRKTSTSRQSDLVRLLVGGPANLRLIRAKSLSGHEAARPHARG